MSMFWRIALAWLLAVALPIQGYAAQTLLFCGSASHHRSGMGDQAGHAHEHGAMSPDDVSGHGHAAMNSKAGDADKTAAAKAGHAGKCSVCSSCCNAPAITPSVLNFAVAALDLPEVETLKRAHDRVMVGGLERPPRG